MESYEKIKKVLALGFMNFLDDNKSKGKMCLSNGECEDIEKAFNEQDWPRLAGYLDKYTESEDERIWKVIDEIMKLDKAWEIAGKHGLTAADIRRWVKKQKEPTPADGWDYADKRMSHPLYWEGFEAGRSVERELSEFEKQKEQKPISFNDSYNTDEYEVVMEGNATSLKRKDQKPVDYEHEMWKNCEANFEGGKKEVIEHPEKYGLQKKQNPAQTEQSHSGLICAEVLNEARENKYVRGQLLWELMHNGIISEADHIYLMDDDRKPWTTNEHQKSYKEGFSAAEELQKLTQKPTENNVIIPQFRIGDYIKPKAYNEEHLIKDINKDGYVLDIDFVVPFKYEDVWEVVKPKQEWNEEEKTIIEGACNALEIYGHSKLAEKLKSLR